MAYTIETTSQYFILGIEYAFFWWGIFALYCIRYQINRIRLYRQRSKQLSGQQVDHSRKRIDVFRRLNFAIRIPFITEMIAVKHVLGLLLFCAINLIFIFFAPFVYGDGGYNTNTTISYFDRRAAFVGMINWGFVFFLAQRNSILVKMSGLTFEQLIPFHRIIARIGLAEFFPHFIWRMIVGYNKTLTVKGIFARNTEQLTGIIAMFSFLLMFITSIEYIRRNYFQVFYYCHVTFLLVAIVAACYHETTCFAVFIPAIILWFADRVVRSYYSWIAKSEIVHVDTFEASDGGVTRVMFKHPMINKSKPGQYVFSSMVVSGKQLLQYTNWHPFTISELIRVSDQDADADIEERIVGENGKTEVGIEGHTAGEKDQTEKTIMGNESSSEIVQLRRRGQMVKADESSSTIASIHIKTLGRTTTRVFDAYQENQDIKVYIDGPYGPKLEYQDYEVLALFATGVGATPGLAIIKDIIEKRSRGVKIANTRYVNFVWSIKAIDELNPFIEMIEYWYKVSKTAVLPIQLNMTVFVTRTNTVYEIDNVNVVSGERVQIDKEMKCIAEAHSDKKVWVHACGPIDFVRKVSNRSAIHQLDFHNETFEF